MLVVVKIGGTAKKEDEHKVCSLTRLRAAFWARIVGFGRATLGAGGGRAAVCGDAISGRKGVLEVGMTMGGES